MVAFMVPEEMKTYKINLYVVSKEVEKLDV
jgi:hypothetical protein